MRFWLSSRFVSQIRYIFERFSWFWEFEWEKHWFHLIWNWRIGEESSKSRLATFLADSESQVLCKIYGVVFKLNLSRNPLTCYLAYHTTYLKSQFSGIFLYQAIRYPFIIHFNFLSTWFDVWWRPAKLCRLNGTLPVWRQSCNTTSGPACQPVQVW